ncbi:hypothetical protein [Salmonirosea aquatica]|uniref:Secretion system C-terminal sorting domain-containing protein n=1 Tax=Salmonirosea aquatica TaxID=2654236 RepID=A0A7C9BCZ2_9BACT|nr:hypothetical protein [Cytophagaceae bacterium SJW1-29]
MKTVKHILTATMFGLFLNLTGTAHAADSRTDSSTAQPEKASFQVAMYQVINSLKMNVRIEKKGAEKITVKIFDKQGIVLYTDILGKKQHKYARTLNLSELGDGEYSLVVSNGTEEVVKELRLSTKELYQMPERLLVAAN